VILAGHSWAGMVISETRSDPKVAGLVYSEEDRTGLTSGKPRFTCGVRPSEQRQITLSVNDLQHFVQTRAA
jgi:hypothetical protein